MGSGKSFFLEVLAANYLMNGGHVIDLFAAKDGENLSWLRSPFAKEYSILLHGDGVVVKAEWPNKPISKIGFKDLVETNIIISSPPLYSSVDEEYNAVNRLINILYTRKHWCYPIYLLIRETANHSIQG